MSNKIHPIKSIVENFKNGDKQGIFSVCTANREVIEACMDRLKERESYLLIEATANQVNQYGGYTGMKPADFVEFINQIAAENKFPIDRVILGGDHLGPLTWTNLKQDEAMENAKVLIKEYVLAGFTKIHIDTSMPIYDDLETGDFGDGIIADRAGVLCKVAEDAYEEVLKTNSEAIHPVYVIGSEVPIPGGVQAEENEESSEEIIDVTKVSDFNTTVNTFKEKFKKYGVSDAFNYVVGVVVQPGVEFSSDKVWKYNKDNAKALSSELINHNGIVFEAHSTDYQPPKALKEMVHDGFAILKVGPALTFGFREGAFLLNKIEEEMFKYNPAINTSNFIDILEFSMLKNPKDWIKHYSGTPENINFSRKYSLSDRCRYYMPNEDVKFAFDIMINNLNKKEIPIALISQFMHNQYKKVRDGQIKATPIELLKDFIGEYVDDYIYATEEA